MKVLELRGYKSLRALNAYSALMLGMKMLPAYMHESYEEFYARVEAMDEDGARRIFREGAQFVELEKDEMEAMLSFATDSNNVPYSPENVKNLKPHEMVEIIVEVSMAILRMKIDFVSEEEKKKSVISR